MNLLVLVLTLAMACLFLGAVVQKALDLPRFVSTLEQLGFLTPTAHRVAPIIILVELLASLSLIFRPESLLTFTLVIALSSSFAAASLIAIIRKEKIQCRCFGPYGHGTLGAAQLWSMPVWLAAALLSWLKPALPSTIADKTVGFAIVCLLLASAGAARSLKSWRDARGDRRSAQEMYVWLQS